MTTVKILAAETALMVFNLSDFFP